MRLVLIIQSNADAEPRRELFEIPVVTMGRDPTSVLLFDMAKDLDVSTRHAEIREEDGVVVIVDKDSTNGTWVNGARVRGARELHAGDVINLGRKGPELRVEALGADVWHPTIEHRGLPPVPTKVPSRRHRTREWLADALATQARQLKLMVSGIVVGVAALAVGVWLSVRNMAVDEPLIWREVTMPAIRKANDGAVVLIETTIPGTRCAQGCEGTGFGVTAEGLIVTNRHVVVQDGRRASSIQVKFANSATWLRATVVKIADDKPVDLALLQISATGPFPTVGGVSSNGADLPIGSDVMTIGFPRGTLLVMDGEGASIIARTTTTVGSIAKSLPEVIQIDASADHGSSGSPVFDRHGHVVGVVSGGERNVDKVVYVVPSGRILALSKAAGRPFGE